jgi:hypothetical protein
VGYDIGHYFLIFNIFWPYDRKISNCIEGIGDIKCQKVGIIKIMFAF